MNQASEIKPKNALEVFRIVSEEEKHDEVKLNFGPIVFYVPERSGHGLPSIFVVAEGWLTLKPDFNERRLLTKEFGTQVAYFKQEKDTLKHVYGVHYDMDEEKPGHPVFHAQFSPQTDLKIAVQSYFHHNCEVENCMTNILKTVRMPSAQMDIFSVFCQICADHLISPDSGPEVKEAFKKLRENCNFLVGAAHRLDFLNGNHAAGCYRASHWYDSPKANE